ncbi:hypothetical protein GCM10025734_18790 [Kitasatospora paranensis]
MTSRAVGDDTDLPAVAEAPEHHLGVEPAVQREPGEPQVAPGPVADLRGDDPPVGVVEREGLHHRAGAGQFGLPQERTGGRVEGERALRAALPPGAGRHRDPQSQHARGPQPAEQQRAPPPVGAGHGRAPATDHEPGPA